MEWETGFWRLSGRFPGARNGEECCVKGLLGQLQVVWAQRAVRWDVTWCREKELRAQNSPDPENLVISSWSVGKSEDGDTCRGAGDSLSKEK